MSRPAFELAGIFRQYGETYRKAHKLPDPVAKPDTQLIQDKLTCASSPVVGSFV